MDDVKVKSFIYLYLLWLVSKRDEFPQMKTKEQEILKSQAQQKPHEEKQQMQNCG